MTELILGIALVLFIYFASPTIENLIERFTQWLKKK